MLSVIIAVFAYSLIDVGKTVQKVGIHLWEKSRAKGAAVWFSGILAGTVSSFLILYAVSKGSVIVVGSVAGIGIVAMIFIARITLHEKVGPFQLAAIGLIVSGPFFMAGASQYSVDIEYNGHALWILIAALIFPCLIAALFFRKKRYFGIILVIAGGILSGLVVVFQKLSASPIGKEAALVLEFTREVPDFVQSVVSVMLNPYAVVWIVLSIVSTLLLQLAHKVVQAVRSIPVFNSGVILTPVLAGSIVFAEKLRLLQWVGVASIIIGMTVLIVRPPKVSEEKELQT